MNWTWTEFVWYTYTNVLWKCRVQWKYTLHWYPLCILALAVNKILLSGVQGLGWHFHWSGRTFTETQSAPKLSVWLQLHPITKEKTKGKNIRFCWIFQSGLFWVRTVPSGSVVLCYGVKSVVLFRWWCRVSELHPSWRSTHQSAVDTLDRSPWLVRPPWLRLMSGFRRNAVRRLSGSQRLEESSGQPSCWRSRGWTFVQTDFLIRYRSVPVPFHVSIARLLNGHVHIVTSSA